MSMDDEDLDERLRSALNNAFTSLDPQTREIISCHFGLGSPFDAASIANTDKVHQGSNGSGQATAPEIDSQRNGISRNGSNSNGVTELVKKRAAAEFAPKKPDKNGSNSKTPIDQKSISELALEYGLSTDQVESRKDDGLRALIYGRKTRFRCS